MKKKIIPLVVLLGTIGAYAQTGIGTPLPHGTAELEISSKDKGVLIPRVELVNETDVNTVKGGVYPESLLVYNTGVGVSKIDAGFYFWNKDKWSALVSNSTLYKYIKETAKDGNVTITNTGGNNFTFTWVDKTTDKETSATLEELIKGMETITTLTESNDSVKATLTYKNEENKAPKVIDLTTLLQGSSEFKEFLKGYITNVSIKETITKIDSTKNTEGKNNGTYTYFNEENKEFKITVIDDVNNNFGDIINNEGVKNILNEYLQKGATGNVTYEGGKFYYVKNEGGTITKEEIDFSQLVRDNETLTTLKEVVAGNAGKYEYKDEKGGASTIDVVKGVTDNSKTIFENKTVIDKIIEQIKENAKPGTVTVTGNEKDNNLVFEWKDKDGVNHTVDFKTLVKEYETLTSLSLKDTQNKEVVLNYKDEDGTVGDLDISAALSTSETFKEFLKGYITNVSIKETITKIDSTKNTEGKNNGTYTYFNEENKEFKITVIDDVNNNFGDIINNEGVKNILNEYLQKGATGNVTYEGGKFYYVKNEGGIITKEVIDISDMVKFSETDTPIKATTKKVGEAIVNTGEYKYKSEKSAEITINVVEDVANNFDKVINNNEFKTVFNKYLTENVEGNVTYKNNKFYYTVKNGDNYEQKEITIEEIIKDNAYLASLQVTPVDENTGKVLGGFKFSSGKAGEAEVKFAETLTTISKGKQTGTDEGANFIAYNYKDETGQNATSQITVTSDVIDSFNQIIKDNRVITELNNFISGATGSVTVTKGPNGDIILGYKDGDTPETVNLTTLIAEKETKTDIKKTNATGVEVAIETKPAVGMIFYEYENENKQKRYISVSQDVSDDFSKIVENNKTILENLIKQTGGNASISKDTNGNIIITNVETKEDFNITDLIKANGAIAKLELTAAANNINEVKAGFTFNNGKAGEAEVKFAETLTKITLVPYDVFVYKELLADGTEKVTHENEMLADPGNKVFHYKYQANKFVYENEKGQLVEVKGSELFKTTNSDGGNPGTIETLTSLSFYEDYQTQGPCLVYKDEEKIESYIKISDMFKFSEKITTLELNSVNRQLIFTNETGRPVVYQLDDLVQEPWYVAKVTGNEIDKQATKNTEDIYTNGWVGIGFDKKSTAPNERLRVKGSITATNSYYADYVFESYFDGYSSLKYDYKFNDLNTVDSFIKTNRHLPGITPISDLEKTDMGYSFNVSELSIQLLEKTEELFLHVIDQQKELNAKETRIEKLESEMSDMAKRLELLEGLLTK